MVSSHAYEESRRIMAEFIAADPEYRAVIFGKNATKAINKLSNPSLSVDGFWRANSKCKLSCCAEAMTRGMSWNNEKRRPVEVDPFEGGCDANTTQYGKY